MKLELSSKSIKKHFNILIYLVLFFTFLVHVSYIGNGFAWLDHLDIAAKESVLPLGQLYKAFLLRFSATGFYRPLVTILNSLDYAFYQYWAPGYHLTNVLLQTAATATMVGFVSAFFTLASWQILLAVLIFGVHPLSILPVGAISYRPELLLAIFTFLSLSYYSKYRRSGKSQFGFKFILAFLAGLFSKESAIILIPLLVVFWEFLHLKNKQKLEGKVISGTILSLVLYLFLRSRAIPEFWHFPGYHLTFYQRIGTSFASLNKLLSYLFIPLKPALSDSIIIQKLLSPATLIFAAVFFLLIYLCKRLGLRSSLSTGLILILIFLLPAFNLLPLPRFTSPHYAYLAAAPFGVLIALILVKFKGKQRILLMTLFGVWISVMIYSTFSSGFQFKNDQTLFTPEVKRDPYYLEGQYYLGSSFLVQRDFTSAKKHFSEISNLPKDRIAFADKYAFYLNLGNIAYLEGDYAEAAKFFKTTSSYASTISQKLILSYNQALIAQKNGDYKQVVKLLSPYLSYWNRPEPLILLSKALALTGNQTEAKNILKKVLLYYPENQRESLKKYIEGQN